MPEPTQIPNCKPDPTHDPTHVFAARVALKYFSDQNCKRYMITHPMRNMTYAMSKCLGPDLHLGNNLDLICFDSLNQENQKLIKQHPPIIHCSEKIKIAKKGVNLSEYLKLLPDDKAEIIIESGKPLMHYCPMTIDSLIAAVELTVLSNCN